MESEHEQLSLIKSLFIKMGASEKQAVVMASQLLKRAGQIAAERKISKIESIEALLKQVIEAQQES
jgi:hypothetical protein